MSDFWNILTACDIKTPVYLCCGQDDIISKESDKKGIREGFKTFMLDHINLQTPISSSCDEDELIK